MSGFDNEVMYADGERLEVSSSRSISIMQKTSTDISRINFTGNPNGLVAANPSSLCHDPVSGNLWLKVSGTGTTVWEQVFSNPSDSVIKLTENTGTSLPDVAGNINVLGPNSALTGYSPWTVGVGSTATVNMPGTVKWVVNATANLGTHTTIQAAITAASAGDDVFITPGTYTENLTLKVGVNLVAYNGDGETPQVTIVGTCTLTTAGTVSITGIRLQTNAAAFLAVTGSAASIVNLNNCYLNCTNNTGITFSSSSSSAVVNMSYCKGNLAANGIGLFTSTSAGQMQIYYTFISNTGASTTASTTSTGIVLLRNSVLTFVLSTSSTGTIDAVHTQIGSGTNTTAITTAGTGVSGFHLCYLQSGSASAVSIGAGTTVSLTACDLNSSNTNVITGAGTLNATNLSFSGTSSVINPTTVNGTYTNLVNYKATSQPSFSAYVNADITNITGNGAQYVIIANWTELSDIGANFSAGVFTAPVTGTYRFEATISMLGLAGVTSLNCQFLATSANIYFFEGLVAPSPASNRMAVSGSCQLQMTAGNTISLRVQGQGAVGDTADVAGAGGPFFTFFSGSLIG